jgi:toxin ParE1/3/4
MSRFRLSRQADADLEEIARYVAVDNPQAAVGIIEALEVAFRILADAPEIGSLRDDLMPGLRMFSPKRPASNYIIFYYILPERPIEISDVIHTSRDWATLFQSGQRGSPPAS